MFRRQIKSLSDILAQALHKDGLETPLNQLRAVEAWDQVAGTIASKYTKNKFIKNQTLFVQIINPALRQDLSMQKTELVKKINDAVGFQVIYDIKLY